MEDQFTWKVSLSGDDYVEVKSAEDAAKLGKKFASLIADLGVYKAEVERLRKGSFVTAVPSEQYERLRKAGDAMYHTAQQDGTGLWLHKSFQDWRDAK